MQFGLKEEVIKAIEQVLEQNPRVDKAFIFGSRAKGNYKQGSDIDLALKGDLTAKDVLDLHGQLDELNLPYKFDLVNYDSISEPALKEHVDRVGVEMYKRWKVHILEEVVEKFIDYRGKTPTKTGFGIPLITAKIVKDGKLLEPNEFIAAEDYETWMTRGYPEIDDVILTTEAPLGEVALIQDKNVALAQRIITLRTKREICNSIFLKYYLQSDVGKSVLHSRASGSTVEGIKSSELKKIKIYLPPIDDQNSIAELLKSLDNKIDLLHRQNKTLEQMAETLFRQWFVEQSDESWEKKSLFDMIELIGGGTPKTDVPEYWNGSIKWLSGGDIASSHKDFIISTEKSISELGLSNSSAKLLPKFSTVISARGTVGKYCLLSEPMAFSQSNYGIKPKYDNCYFFTYLLVAHSVDELQAAAYGSVFDTITTNTFKEHIIRVPKEDSIFRFEESVAPYFKKMLINKVQISTLAQLTDGLLAKLMNGEIRINLEDSQLVKPVKNKKVNARQ